LIASTQFSTRAGDVSVTASFGIASTGLQGPDLALKVETLIRAADESLYKAKLAGRNCLTGQELGAPMSLAAHG
jgi:PleD family two-component response regulator